jgi:uncharacterized membrane protein (UPF0136 family)
MSAICARHSRASVHASGRSIRQANGARDFLLEKPQIPISKMQRSSKLQYSKRNYFAFWSLVIGVSLELGFWDLEFPSNWTVARCWITGAAIPPMLGPAKIYFIIFGALTIAGGVIGYVKAGSVPSIIAGVITGVLLIIAGFVLPEHRVAGLAIALIVSLLLAGQFIPKFIRTGKAMPAGIMSILSAIGMIVALIAWFKK